MAVSATSGARFYIGPSLSIDTLEALSDSDAITYFENLSYTEVEDVETLGDLGDVSDVASFASIKDTRVRKFKTTRNAGTMNVVCGRNPLDAGQDALIAAEKTKFNFSFKLVFADAADADDTDSVLYFGGMVMSRANAIGAVTDVTKRNFAIGVNTGIYEVASEVVT